MWIAIRDMDLAAELMGIRPLQTKLLAFAVSSYYCGVAGALLVFLWYGGAEYDVFNINQSFFILFMVIIGGSGQPHRLVLRRGAHLHPADRARHRAARHALSPSASRSAPTSSSTCAS